MEAAAVKEPSKCSKDPAIVRVDSPVKEGIFHPPLAGKILQVQVGLRDCQQMQRAFLVLTEHPVEG